MNHLSRSAFLVTVALAIYPSASTQAAPIGAGETVIFATASQDIRLFAGTPFNPGTEDQVITNVTGQGLLVLTRDSQDGSTIAIPSVAGLFVGSNPDLANGAIYEFGTFSPGSIFSGSITNVEVDESDPGFDAGSVSAFVSGDYEVSGDFFDFSFINGASLTTGPVSFNAVFDGLPPTPGTIIDGGTDEVDIFFGDTVIGVSTNRMITAIPEPASATLAGGLAVAMIAVRRRRKRS